MRAEDMLVLIAHNHPALRNTMVRTLAAKLRIEVAGMATNGSAAVEPAPELQPDVVLTDVVWPPLNGIEATRKIKSFGA